MGVSSSFTFFFFVAFNLFHIPALASAEGSTKFDYSQIAKWGSLDPKFATCSKGNSQSPIDIKVSDAVVNKTTDSLKREYVVHSALLHSDGLDVEVKFNVTGGITIDGKRYVLKQMHWHTPSEHRLDGVQYAAELHQVHVAEDGSRRAVIGILHKEGPPNPVLTMLKPQLDELAKKPCEAHEQEIEIPKFDSGFLKKRPRNYYRYHGSLTTPPCDENVIWNVIAEVTTISKEQVDALKAPACVHNKNNARPTQLLNGRTVQKHEGN